MTYAPWLDLCWNAGAMAPLAHTARLSTLLVLLAAPVGGCGAAKPQGAKGAPSNPVATTAAPAVVRTDPLSPTSAGVSISDEIRAKCGISDADAYFAFDSATVTSTSRTPLDRVVQCFTKGPLASRTVSLVGRADPRGPSEFNMTLGQSRADAVGGYLTAHGMSKAKTQTTSRGAIDATGQDETTWQHDRRVDVSLGN